MSASPIAAMASPVARTVSGRIQTFSTSSVRAIRLWPSISVPSRRLAHSVSTVAEAAALAPFASYLGVGAVYGSATKLDAGDPVGPERIAEIRNAIPHIPIVAIGGITRDNVGVVARAGADAAAVVSAVVCADDMRVATAALVLAWGGHA